jgi:Ca2+-binding RTX toxin-like protein
MHRLLVAALCATTVLLTAASTGHAQERGRCGKLGGGEQCQERHGAKTPGGTGKVSHKGWPAITGVLWKVVTDGRGKHHHVGTSDNDELLGRHGNDTITGGPGKDVVWGDWDAGANPAGQVDVLRGGAGNDFLYPSHGKNTLLGGPGNDRIIAYYGHGTIDCGPGTHDYAQTRTKGAYSVRNCERVRHFCAYGSKPNGDCKKPGDSALAMLTQSAGADQRALLSRLVAW